MQTEPINNVEEFKALDQTTRDFYIYTKLVELSNFITRAEKRYAKKWVEKTMIIIGGTAGTAIIYSLLNLVLIQR